MRARVALALALALAGCSNTRNAQQPGVRAGDVDAGGPVPALVDGLVINEVSAADDFVELFNRGPSVRLEGWSLVDGAYVADDPATADHRLVLPPATLVAGGRLLVDALPFGLGEEDAVRLLDPDGREVDAVVWTAEEADVDLCRLPDGEGPVQACAPTPGQANAPLAEPRCGDGHRDEGEACDGAALGGRTCVDLGRGPGVLGCEADCLALDASGCGPPPTPSLTLVINELTSADDDAIELYNPGPDAVELGGCAVADTGYDPTDAATADARYVLPPGELPAGGLLVLRKGADHAFGLGGEDTLRLFDPAGRLLDETAWPDGAARTSWCRLPDGEGAFSSCEFATFGALNAGPPPPRCGDGQVDEGEGCDGVEGSTCADFGFDGGELACAPDCARFLTDACTVLDLVVINEVTSGGDDAIELYNGSQRAADLAGYAVADADFDPEDPEATAEHRHALAGLLAPGAYLVLRKGQDHAFGLGQADGVRLFNAAGELTDETAWEAEQAAVSWCRLPDGAGPFQACDGATFGAANR